MQTEDPFQLLRSAATEEGHIITRTQNKEGGGEGMNHACTDSPTKAPFSYDSWENSTLEPYLCR